MSDFCPNCFDELHYDPSGEPYCPACDDVDVDPFYDEEGIIEIDLHDH